MLTTKTLFQADGLDDRSLDFLAQAIERNNLPGFDYLEFKRAVAQLKELKLDEATAFKSAFTTAATLGLTKEKLIETAGYYRNIVEKEQTQFTQALENQNATKVSSRQNDVSRLKDQIERHKADIERMKEELAAYQNQVEQAEAAAKTEAEKLEKAKAAFEKTNQAVLRNIDQDVENLHKHL
jgi:predicted RNase H-like nuclease (RuvC/YqgF family)